MKTLVLAILGTMVLASTAIAQEGLYIQPLIRGNDSQAGGVFHRSAPDGNPYSDSYGTTQITTPYGTSNPYQPQHYGRISTIRAPWSPYSNPLPFFRLDNPGIGMPGLGILEQPE